MKVWYDKEADYLEVLFDRKAGYFRETENDAVMEKETGTFFASGNAEDCVRAIERIIALYAN